jgi:hypothetical protein
LSHLDLARFAGLRILAFEVNPTVEQIHLRAPQVEQFALAETKAVSARFAYSASPINPLRGGFSFIREGKFGTRSTIGGVTFDPCLNIARSWAVSRLIVAFPTPASRREPMYCSTESVETSSTCFDSNMGFKWFQAIASLFSSLPPRLR